MDTHRSSHAPRARLAALAAALLAAPPLASAAADPSGPATPEAATPRTPRLVLGAALLAGFDDLLRTTGSDGSTQSVDLGGRAQAWAGAEFPLDRTPLALQFTLGIARDSHHSGSGGLTFTRLPIEASLMWQVNPSLRWGAGVHVVANPRIEGTGTATTAAQALSLSASPGFVLLGEYALGPHLSLQGRYVFERYTPSAGPSINSSHFGLGAAAYF